MSASGKGVKLHEAQRQLMKLIEKQNAERVVKLQRMRKNNLITGCVLGITVASIYTYSILAVKQETFLDDFNPPEKIVE